MKLSECSGDMGGKKLIRALLYGMIFAVGSCTIVLLIAAIMMSKSDMPQSYVNLIADFAVIISSLVAGITASKIIKKRGLLVGAIMGLTYYLVIMVMSLIFFDAQLSAAAITKLIMMVISAVIGGIIGVNLKKRNKYGKI